uniref:trypsin-1-like isoform X2 n=1 Tax=Ciona intestinalis TaxID=7719 RepID=UPI00089DCD80|nr:trypsin-1-like isoform X2 [Ciona intestinalis]|eukprot:XP_018669670.1 trypsin-1-like isoform X2 [Ciona intestinalis]
MVGQLGKMKVQTYLSLILFMCINLSQSSIPKSGNSKIVGGAISKLGKWPWQGLLVYTPTNQFFCGCSLISERYVLTAAHCTAGLTQFYVIFGVFDQKNLDAGSQSYSLLWKIEHSGYVPKTFENDIALLKTRKPILYTVTIKAIALPSQGINVPTGTVCWITGWGKTSESATSSPSVLHEAQVPVISQSQCRSWYSPSTIYDVQFCAGYEMGSVDTCQGDSGGPLVCATSSSTYVLQGITSFGNGCARPEKPGVYTRVSEFVDWIFANTDIVGATEPTVTTNATEGTSSSTTSSSNPKLAMNIGVLCLWLSIFYILCPYIFI